ncbi:hypothetical protein ACQ4PT_021956 [Festuca glaucescens]
MTTVTATDGASTIDKGCSSSPAFSAGGVKAGAGPGSSPSHTSTTSSSTSSLLGTPNSARSPEKQGGAVATPKGDAVRRCLRSLAKMLQRNRAGVVDEQPKERRERRRKRRSRKQPNGRVAGVIDGTAREREDGIASAIAYCKETMSGRRSGTSRPPPSPSLDGWLLDRPEEEFGTAARCKCPVLRRDVLLLEWLPEAPACTSSAAVPHHCGRDAFDECGGKSAAETGKRAALRGPAGELGMSDILDELNIDVLRLTNYFAEHKYVRAVQHRRAASLALSFTLSKLS